MFPFSSASSISKVPVVSVTVSAYVFLADQATITVLSFESDETGKVTAVNHYGTSQYARTIYKDEEETTFYYQFNAYGDVTALIGTDGSTIAKYEYDAFGNLTSQPDAKVNNSITYRGYEYDAETGLYYLNARYYDSETARFLTEDTYRGEKNDPLSLNLYTYCKNNPLKYTDPTGHMVSGVIAFLGDFIVLSGITIVAILATGFIVYEIEESSNSKPSLLRTEEKTPDVKYPGNDPTKSPGSDWEWKGKGAQGSSKGNYVNPRTGESLHPDLEHPTEGKGIGPHWDYKSPGGKWYRLFPNGEIQPK